MPSFPTTLLFSFGAQAGPIPTPDLDTDFGQLANAVNDLRTAGNFFVDSGTPNNVVITIPAGMFGVFLGSLIGLQIQIGAGNTNTGAATLNINSLGTVPINNSDGSPLTPGQLLAGQIVDLQYDGTQFQLIAPTYSSGTFNATINGCTVGIAVACFWTRAGNQVTMWFNAVTGTSNATTMTITSLPATLIPARGQQCACTAIDNGANVVAYVGVSGATLNWYKGAPNGAWTNTGSKGTANGVITYMMN